MWPSDTASARNHFSDATAMAAELRVVNRLYQMAVAARESCQQSQNRCRAIADWSAQLSSYRAAERLREKAVGRFSADDFDGAETVWRSAVSLFERAVTEAGRVSRLGQTLDAAAAGAEAARSAIAMERAEPGTATVMKDQVSLLTTADGALDPLLTAARTTLGMIESDPDRLRRDEAALEASARDLARQTAQAETALEQFRRTRSERLAAAQARRERLATLRTALETALERFVERRRVDEPAGGFGRARVAGPARGGAYARGGAAGRTGSSR